MPEPDTPAEFSTAPRASGKGASGGGATVAASFFADRELQLISVATIAGTLIYISIAASQIFLGLGTLMLLIYRKKLEFPPIWPRLALFFALTLLSALLSPNPWAGYPQIKKFYVFLFIPLIFQVFSTHFDKAFYLVAGWVGGATASGLWGLTQFVMKYRQFQQAGVDFYTHYVERRITGFEGHWMTFGALQLSVLTMLIAQWCFSSRKLPLWAYSSAFVISLAILLGWTRSIWIAALVSTAYLIACWRPRVLLVIPVVLVVGYLAAPQSTKQRIQSLVAPHGETDSNRHRYVTFLTGIEMIKAHPWFGLGPGEVGPQFNNYVPKDLLPLPNGYYGHLHNIYLQYAAERGIPVLLVFLWLIGQILVDCWRTVRALPPGLSEERFVLQAVIAVTINILVGGLAEFNTGDSEVLMMFLSVVALGYAAIRHSRDRLVRR
jgi:putative inorganic carbon (hco3(-)) transporter